MLGGVQTRSSPSARSCRRRTRSCAARAATAASRAGRAVAQAAQPAGQLGPAPRGLEVGGGDVVCGSRGSAVAGRRRAIASTRAPGRARIATYAAGASSAPDAWRAAVERIEQRDLAADSTTCRRPAPSHVRVDAEHHRLLELLRRALQERARAGAQAGQRPGRGRQPDDRRAEGPGAVDARHRALVAQRAEEARDRGARQLELARERRHRRAVGMQGEALEQAKARASDGCGRNPWPLRRRANRRGSFVMTASTPIASSAADRGSASSTVHT